MKKAAARLLLTRPVQVGRWCGFDRLLDEPHGTWMRQMLKHEEDMTLLAHRGSFKTTCLTIVIATLLLTEPDKSILFLRKTDDDVAEVLRQVQRILKCEAMQYLSSRLWGEPVRLIRSSAADLTTSCFHSPRGSQQLHGQGINGSLTGKHADLIFTDDIVNLQDRISTAEREHTRQIYQELQNIRNPGGQIINTGTPWHREDAICLMPHVQRFDCYTTGLMTDAQLNRLRASMTPSLFAANYELKHIASEEALFTTAPAFTEDINLLKNGIAHIDAAYGGEDFTALTCGRHVNGNYVLYGRLWRKHVDDVLPEILQECERLMCAPIFLESNGDKGYLTRELRRMGAQVRPYSEHMNKYVKIATILRKLWPDILFLKGTDPDYLSQILDYSLHAQHDDAPDSAACVMRVLAARQRMG